MTPNEDRNHDFERIMQDLRAQFVRALELRILELDANVQKWTATGDVAALQGIASVAHKLAGISGSLGHSQLGRDARSLDEAVTMGLDGAYAAGWEKVVILQVEHLMDDIEVILDQ